MEGWIFKKGAKQRLITLGWEGGRVDFQKWGQVEKVITLGWEGGRVDFQKRASRDGDAL